METDDSSQAIKKLEEKNLLYKKRSTGSFVFKTRAGTELKSEVKRLREIKGENINYAKVLSDVAGDYFIIPRRYNTVYKMTRYFSCEYMKADVFLNIDNSKTLLDGIPGDGKVIKLFDFSKINQKKVENHIKELGDKRLVVVCPTKALNDKESMRDFEIIKEIQENQVFRNNHEILVKELPLLLEDLTAELENTLISLYEMEKSTKVFFFDGESVVKKSAACEEEAVNACCEIVYNKTAIINNEMINRSILNTAQTRKARINVVNAILKHIDDEEFYSGSNQEATIYRALFCQTGLVGGELSEAMCDIITEINLFIDSCCDERISVARLINRLISAPYGLRMGVIPCYLAYVLSKRKEDIVVYFSNKEV